ncbi:MAG TPA: hypothetical protein VH370_27225 [Humisphaera sp.]|jgi:hypothetical protein|nr:hypothetical protein [Humisphaera sp.]
MTTSHFSFLLEAALLGCGLLMFPLVSRADEKHPAADALPAIAQLPDPFLLKDGSRVATAAQWAAHREELKELILSYEYGHLPPASAVTADVGAGHADPATGAIETQVTLHVGPAGQVPVKMIITSPPGTGPFPVILKGDLCWGRVLPAIVANVNKHGYMLVEFDRTDVAPDKNEAPGGVRPLYPDYDFATLAAWAWGYHRSIDYLLTRTDVDPKRIVITGHSRGGKATLLAGALDERVALTAPNASGCGGSGCYRFQAKGSEQISDILKNFPYWFKSDFNQFIGKVDRLPFDQHTLKALVAPRALFTTESQGDLWANPEGTQLTLMAAREVYNFLGVPEKIGTHYRQGKHEQNEADFAALLDFADHLFAGTLQGGTFVDLPYKDAAKAFEWAAPTKQ